MSFRLFASFAVLLMSFASHSASAASAQERYCQWNGVSTTERELRFGYNPRLTVKDLSEGQTLFQNVTLVDTRYNSQTNSLYCYVSKKPEAGSMVVDCFNSRMYGADLVAKMRFPLIEGAQQFVDGNLLFSLVDRNGQESAQDKLFCGTTVNQTMTSMGLEGLLLGLAMKMGLFSGTCL